MQHHPILAEIEDFLAKHEMAESTFGRKAVGDWRFVRELRGSESRKPRRVWPETEQAVHDFMRRHEGDVAKSKAAA